MFYLIRLKRDASGELIQEPIPEAGTFEKGSDAGREAKVWEARLGVKVQCRRKSQAPDWRAREKQRIEAGHYRPLPDGWTLQPIADHFAHIAPSDHTKIEFTESEDLAIIDRRTILSPGRYISRFYPEIDDNTRRKLIASIDPNSDLYFAYTREEIAMVYKTGPSSCMDGSHNFRHLPCMPVEAYAGGDLAVVYTKNSRGQIQSRAVCFPAKKLYGRCYGDQQRLSAALDAEGWTYVRNFMDDERRFMNGAKLLKIEADKGQGTYVMPYLDDINYAVDKGDHFLSTSSITNDDIFIQCGGTGGYSPLFRYCPKWNGPMPAHDFAFVEGVNQWWSRRAISEHAFTCAGSNKIYPREQRVPMADGRYWSEAHFKEHGAFCSITGRRFPKSELVMRDDKWIHPDNERLTATKAAEARGGNKTSARMSPYYIIDDIPYDPIRRAS